MQICLDDFKKSWGDLDKLSKLNESWEKLVGLELSRECKPLKIEKKTLVIAVNHPQWRQALIYNKHKLKDSICRFGVKLNEIKIIQNLVFPSCLGYDKSNGKVRTKRVNSIFSCIPE